MFPEFGNREIRGNEHGFSLREANSRTGVPGLFRGHGLQCFSNTAGDMATDWEFRECPLVSGRCSCNACTPECHETQRRWPDARVAIAHRAGHLEIGELAVVVAAAAAHRSEAYHRHHFRLQELKTFFSQ